MLENCQKVATSDTSQTIDIIVCFTGAIASYQKYGFVIIICLTDCWFMWCVALSLLELPTDLHTLPTSFIRRKSQKVKTLERAFKTLISQLNESEARHVSF